MRFLLSASFLILTVNFSLITSQSQHEASKQTIFCDNETETQFCLVHNQAIRNSMILFKTDMQMERIEKLLIQKCSLEVFPANIAENFPNLKEFSVLNGNFKNLTHENFQNLISLTTLEVKNGKLAKIDQNSFNDLTSLENLSLEKNEIVYIHSKTFWHLENLKVLNLNRNQLTILHPKTFEKLINLHALNCQNNQLVTLDRQLFVNKPKLSIIRARQNDFIHIDEFAFDGLPNLREIELFSARDCRIGFISVENSSLFELSELKEELRDNCKGSDFKIMEMHAAMLETIEENGDSLKIY